MPDLMADPVAHQSRPSSSRHNASSDSETARSFSTTTTARRKRRTTTSQAANRTTYALAYPAPVFTDKTLVLKHLRPRLYVQLQQQSADGRHFEPCIDVVSLAPPRDPLRLMSVVKKRLKKMKSRGDLKSTTNNKKNDMHMDKHDILLVRTDHETQRPISITPDDDHDHDSNNNNSGSQATEDVLGRMLPGLEDLTQGKALAVLRPGTNTILTQDGRSWTASKRANGSFEFLHVDQYGLQHTVRWVTPRRRASISSPPLGSVQLRPTTTMASTATGFSMATTAAGGGSPEVSFNFSVIDPSSRRHAVLATLDSSCLQIKNTYTDPVDSATMSPKIGAEAKVVDEATRTLILATSVWLDLQLGWSPSYEASAKC